MVRAFVRRLGKSAINISRLIFTAFHVIQVINQEGGPICHPIRPS